MGSDKRQLREGGEVMKLEIPLIASIYAVCRYNIGVVTGLCRSSSNTACVEDKSAVCRWWKNWDYRAVDPHSFRMRATM